MARAVIVVPCYNEADRLDLRRFLDFARTSAGIDFLLVNDGSRDRTLELLELLHESQPSRFSFLHLARNCGKAEAVRQGMLMALAAQPDYVGFWDADLATPLEDIPAFCRTLDARPGVTLVIGARMPLLGRSIERRPLRRWLGRAFARAASLALGLRIYDTQCGAKLFRATGEVRQAFERPFVARWIFDVEVFARLHRARQAAAAQPLAQAIYEFPLDRWRDVAGSKLRPADFLRGVLELAHIYWTYLRPGLAAQQSADAPATAPAAESELRQRAA